MHPNGHFVSTDEEIGNILFSHFQSQFQAQDVNLDCLQHLNFKHLNEDHQHELQSPVTDLEFWNAINQLGAWKSPGPDGLQVGFYKAHWDMLA